MVGISEDQVKTAIYCCAYIIDGENISYMGNAVTDKAISISSDSIQVIETTTPSSYSTKE